MKHFGIWTHFQEPGNAQDVVSSSWFPSFKTSSPNNWTGDGEQWWTPIKTTIQLVMAVAVNIEHPSESEKDEPPSESEMLNS